MEEGQKTYNPTVMPLFKAQMTPRASQFYLCIMQSMPVTREMFDQIQLIEIGHRVNIKVFNTRKGKVDGYFERVLPGSRDDMSRFATDISPTVPLPAPRSTPTIDWS